MASFAVSLHRRKLELSESFFALMPIINMNMAKEKAKVLQFPASRMVEGRYDMIHERNKTSMSVRLARQDKFIESLVDLYSSRIIGKLEYHGFDVDTEDFIREYSKDSPPLLSCLQPSHGREHPRQTIQNKREEIIKEGKQDC